MQNRIYILCVNHKTEFNIESETSDGIERNDNTYDNATSTKRVQSSNMAVSRVVEHVFLFSLHMR